MNDQIYDSVGEVHAALSGINHVRLRSRILKSKDTIFFLKTNVKEILFKRRANGINAPRCPQLKIKHALAIKI
jgi:hypothetical protein